MLGDVSVDPTSAGEGVATGVSVGGAATPFLVLTPLAPVAVVAPVLGALVGAVAGGLSFTDKGLSEANKQAILGAIASLSQSVNGTDNPYVLDAIGEAAIQMSRQITEFVLKNAEFVSQADVVVLNGGTSVLDSTRRAAYTKASNLRATGKLGIPLPAGAAQKALEAAAAAMGRAAQEALMSKQTQSRARWVVAIVGTAAVGGSAYWWYLRGRTKRTSPSGR